MKLLIDTNVILDVILAREPWVGDAQAVLDAIERGRAHGYVASNAITTVDYVEEAGQAAASLKVGADYLVTRNEKDFRAASISPRLPGEVLALLQ